MYSKTQIRNAGKNIKEKLVSNETLDVLSFWRSCHANPLDQAYNILQKYANETDKNVLFAKRLKRADSIINKLQRFPSMKLDRINDIGGCRAILSSIKKVDKLVKKLKDSKYFKLHKNYIQTPQDDGYRSIHMVGKFTDKDGKKYTIELQIRTNIQHSWATSVEIVDLFQKESIKAKSGDKNWTNFFNLSSKNLALMENHPAISTIEDTKLFFYLVQGYKKFNQNQKNDLDDLCKLYSKLNILNKFEAYASSIDFMHKGLKENIGISQNISGYILLTLKEQNKDMFKVSMTFYPENDLEKAENEYIKYEKEFIKNNNSIVALISSTALGGIKEAYPNYFADTTKFIKYLKILVDVNNKYKKSFLSKFFKF